MASQNCQRRFKDMTNQEPGKDNKTSSDSPRSPWKLAVSVAMPLFITMTMVLLFGSGKKYRVLATIFWLPPLWFIHLASLGSSFLMGLAAWLVWSDGGFDSESHALPLYVAQISLSMVWNPLVLVIGVAWLGFVFCVIQFGTLFACYFYFKRVSPSAEYLIRPCLTWVAYLTFVTCQLIAYL
ncbi:translocator protein homolog [Ziziphus jujuba]|uniref:Translocator protein homolog n=2 Tax=Ziziphus jujuba TaxID=326968 RepID=A0A6P4ANX4_ZIZJJ|nr:translocator protein homolog [Ziziphus jujuba]KAH7513360.1 hypothetical protein FEM48_Zijuj12G0191800 [Ziziphus jujuba var. spinosa]